MADLIERNVALEKIETLRKAYMLHEPAGMGGMSAICHCRDIVKDIPSANHWISCSERLPEQSEEGQPPNVKCSDCVIVASGDWVGMAYYVTYGEESQWEFADAQNKPKIDWTEVTHWMPLPSTEGLT